MLKPATLKEAERHFVAAHTQIGAEILTKGGGRSLRMAQEVAKLHHEHWNGEGYPHRRAGLQIPASARIVALADAFDAMTHGRPYAPVRTMDEALREIADGCGKQFDPGLGEQFVRFVDGIHRIHGDIDTYLGETSQTTMFSEARKRIRHLLSSVAVADES
jgi:putative two-component system response regulator